MTKIQICTTFKVLLPCQEFRAKETTNSTTKYVRISNPEPKKNMRDEEKLSTFFKMERTNILCFSLKKKNETKEKQQTLFQDNGMNSGINLVS